MANKVSRRQFLHTASIGALGAAMAGALVGCSGSSGSSSTASASGTYTRALVDSDDLEWIELSPDTKDDDPAQGGGDDGQDENPLG